MSDTPLHFFGLDQEQLVDHCLQLDLPRYTAKQLLDWVYRKDVIDPHAMTNLSVSARGRLAETLIFDRGRLDAEQVASDGTHKLLLGWPKNGGGNLPDTASSLPVISNSQRGDDPQTECVMIPTDDRRTACVSSQVGCPVGCTFCASGLGGLEGNLSCGQIVEQVHRLGRAGRITNVVFMGMGEPLANFGGVTQAIRILNASWATAIGARRITVSTVGLPAAIRKMLTFEIPVTLALSLHAPNDELRRSLIPWAEFASIEELLDACREYFDKTGREITLEYILIRQVNDRPHHAKQLTTVARTLRANVNLIRYNEVDGLPHRRPADEDVLAFQQILRDGRINTHIRASRGRDIDAACGQLRHESRLR